MKKDSLKAKNLTLIVSTLMMDMAVILAILSGYNTSHILTLSSFPIPLIKNGLIVTGASIIALLINHLLPSELKASIVFWRLWDALPGCRAFSELAHRDQRVDTIALQKKLGSLPTTAKEQNILWYRIFKQHESNMMIQEAHQKFLFFRDVTAISVLMLAIIIIISFLHIPGFVNYKYALTIISAQYLLFMVAARNTANRLVQNVLALEGISTKFTKRPKK